MLNYINWVKIQKRMYSLTASPWLALIYLIAISSFLPNLAFIVSGQKEDLWLIPNRDGELPTYPPEPDLRRRSTNIANANEVLRLTLQQFLDAKDSDLGVYLKSMRERPGPFRDEYGQVIASYKKVFLFISEQFDEFKTQNYAVNQYDKDKLHLCSVARYFSHQTSLKNHRQTLMKRMSDALDYKCHPCTPYKLKQYGTLEDIGLQVPITDYPEGITPDESIGLCNTTNQSSETHLTTKSPHITTETPYSTLKPVMSFYEGKNGTWNRDGDFAPCSPPDDDRNATHQIKKAHEILRQALQSFLDFGDADLGTYLNSMIRRSGNYQDEYGQVILSYKKVFKFIMEQYNETVANNYAVGQFDKDKLDLCSVARFLSHQPKVENRQNLMKRMGDAMGYRCHPCTPYKRKEHDVTIVPETDKISPGGVSPEESFILCDNRTSVTTSTPPNTPTTSGKPNHQSFNYKPCKYSKGIVTCELATFEEIQNVFRRTSITALEKIELTILPSEDNIPEDLLSNKKVAYLVLAYSRELVDVIGPTKLKVNTNAFRSTKNFTKTIDLTGFDSIELDFNFLSEFNQLKNLTFYFLHNVHHSLPTLPSTLPNLQLLDLQGCSGMRELTNFPNLTNGLAFFSLKGISGSDEILDDDTLSKMLDWVLLSSSNTLEYLRIEGSNSITQVPHHIPFFKAMKSLIFRYNNVSTIKTGSLNFTAPVIYLNLHANGIKVIEPGAIQGDFKNAEMSFSGNNLTRFEESVFQPLREQVKSGKGEISGEQNPIDCSDENICHLAWLIKQNNIGASFFSNIRFMWTCSNGTKYLNLLPAGINHCPNSDPNEAP